MSVTRFHVVATDRPAIVRVVHRDPQGKFLAAHDPRFVSAGDVATIYVDDGDEVVTRVARVVATDCSLPVYEGQAGHLIGEHPETRTSSPAEPHKGEPSP